METALLYAKNIAKAKFTNPAYAEVQKATYYLYKMAVHTGFKFKDTELVKDLFSSIFVYLAEKIYPKHDKKSTKNVITYYFPYLKAKLNFLALREGGRQTIRAVAKTNTKVIKQVTDLYKSGVLVEEISKKLNINVEIVRGYIAISYVTSLNVESTECACEDLHNVVDETGNTPEEDFFITERKEKIYEIINTLNERDRNIIFSYFWRDKTLSQIGQTHKLSRERVRQILNITLAKMKKPLKDYA